MRRPLLAAAAAIALVAQPPTTAPVRAAPAYFLPAPAGTTLLVYQGNNSAFDHVAANGSQYAWDFTEGATEFPVVASRGGTVIGLRSDSTNTACRDIGCWKDANYVLIDHGDGTSALYLHLATGSVTVTQGQTVGQGAPIGRADSTGFSYGTHLHFMVEKTPTARTAAGWWWTQSAQIIFADAGDALEGMSYVSANQPAATETPTPTPTRTPTPTPEPTPKPTPTHAPNAPTGLVVGPKSPYPGGAPGDLTQAPMTDPHGNVIGEIDTERLALTWKDRSDNEEGFRVYRIPVAQNCQTAGPNGMGYDEIGAPILVAVLPPNTIKWSGSFQFKVQYTQFGGDPNQYYQWRMEVVAFNAGGTSAPAMASNRDVTVGGGACAGAAPAP